MNDQQPRVCQCAASFGQWWTLHDGGALTCNQCGLPANDHGWKSLRECLETVPACSDIYSGRAKTRE